MRFGVCQLGQDSSPLLLLKNVKQDSKVLTYSSGYGVYFTMLKNHNDYMLQAT